MQTHGGANDGKFYQAKPAGHPGFESGRVGRGIKADCASLGSDRSGLSKAVSLVPRRYRLERGRNHRLA